MTFEQVIQLSQAGFTAEQITSLASVINSPAAPAATPPAAPAATPPANSPTLADVLQKITELTNTITNSNILNSEQPNNGNIGAEDALASLVIPNK